MTLASRLEAAKEDLKKILADKELFELMAKVNEKLVAAHMKHGCTKAEALAIVASQGAQIKLY